jgi:hypothetical protein
MRNKYTGKENKVSNYTEWFPSAVKPVRKGVYETGFFNFSNRGFSYWNGSRWSNQRDWPMAAYKERNSIGGAVQYKVWRGLVRSYSP